MAHKFVLWFVNIFLIFRLSWQQENCKESLGLADKNKIPDKSFSASSEYKSWYAAHDARLNGGGIWIAAQDVAGEYVQVDLGEMVVLTAVATQGRPGQTWAQFIEEYYVGYSSDGQNFRNLTNERGNVKLFQGHNEASINYLPSIYTRYFRLYASKWKRTLCTQMELYGCKAKSCSIKNGGCSEKCIQVDETSVKCACNKTGYEFVDGACQDANECSEKPRPCEHYCNNTDGSYKCSCQEGYTLNNDGKTCDDVNECDSDGRPCQQICTNTPGSYKCSCSPGYSLNKDGKSCDDVDECTDKRCQHNCTNTIGSYKCSCKDGFVVDPYNEHKCKDINECKQKNNCKQLCENLIGSYKCHCRLGYELDQDGYACNDINECKNNSAGCSDGCINGIGSYVCTCPKGYQLKVDEKTCEDTDECYNYNGNCTHFCDNLKGSYKCRCRDGYRLKSDQHSCGDIDECVEVSPCDMSSTKCVNTEPSYRCECLPGYQPMLTRTNACERVKCGAFSTSNKFTVSPSRCLKSDANVFNDTCKFACASGYLTADPTKMVSTCLANRQWSLDEPACIAAKCPPITSVSNGVVRPSECTTGTSYPGQCHIFCDNGYDPVGPSAVVCESNGSFDTDITKIGCKKRVIKPSIRCPSGIHAILPTGSKSMSVADQWQEPYVNVGKITSSPDKNHIFPVGTTEVTFTATNGGETDSCIVRVTISDKEAPTIKFCPSNQYVQIMKGDPVTWPQPEYTDNVGVVKIEVEPVKPGSRLTANDYDIFYTAKDSSGNTNNACTFKVFVTEKICRSEDFVVDAASLGKYCQNSNSESMYCTVFCKDYQNKIFSRDPPAVYLCYHHNATWVPSPQDVPDCVGFSKFTGQCPQGTFKKTDLFEGEICVNCPRGTFENNGACEKCAVGSYQDKEGQLSCKKCPADQGSLTSGAKKCLARCDPGSYSSSGFRTDSELCQLCSIGEYQPNSGSTSCLKCPEGTITQSLGKISSHDCGNKGKIKITGQQNVTEGDTVKLDCRTSALPTFSMSWMKVYPKQPVFGGKVTEKILHQNNAVVGMSYSISNVRYHDGGIYQCHTVNSFGDVKQNVTLTVMKNFG